DQLQHIYETSTDPELQIGALRMLAEFQDPALEKRALEFAVSGKVKNQDAVIQLAIALQVPAERNVAWNFIESHWPQVKAQLTTEMGQILVQSSGSFCSVEARNEVESFYSTHNVSASSMALKHAAAEIDGCMQLRRFQEANLKDWLQQQPGLRGNATPAE